MILLSFDSFPWTIVARGLVFENLLVIPKRVYALLKELRLSLRV